MNKVTNKTRLAEKRYSNQIKGVKREIRLITKKQKKKQNIKTRKKKKIMKSTNINYKKQRRLQNYRNKINMNQIKEEFHLENKLNQIKK